MRTCVCLCGLLSLLWLPSCGGDAIEVHDTDASLDTQPAGNADSADVALSVDAPAVDSRPAGNTDSADVALSIDAPAVDAQPAGDADRPDAAIAVDTAVDAVAPRLDASYSEMYPCKDVSDCCVDFGRACMLATGPSPAGYLYSRAPGAAPLPTLPADCIAALCVWVPVQLFCVQGQCMGVLAGGINYSADPRLSRSHCGYVDLGDAGAPPPPAPDGDLAKTHWMCVTPPG